jgi:hypothetical protein
LVNLRRRSLAARLRSLPFLPHEIPRAALNYLALREGRAWKLLAADKAPLMIALLQALFLGEERSLLSSVLLLERLARELDELTT